MINTLLFAIIVLTWGSAWIMIKFQTGVMAAEVSVAYRIGIAGIVMFVLMHPGRVARSRKKWPKAALTESKSTIDAGRNLFGKIKF